MLKIVDWAKDVSAVTTNNRATNNPVSTVIFFKVFTRLSLHSAKKNAQQHLDVQLDVVVFRSFFRTASCGADNFVAQCASACQTNICKSAKFIWPLPCCHVIGQEPAAMKLNRSLERMSEVATKQAGSSMAFTAAVAVVLVWIATGPVFHFSDTWQLVINTGTTIITFLMVFLIQRSQNKENQAIQLKLNELVAALKGASNNLIDLEDWTEEELVRLHQHYRRLAELAREDKDAHRSLSVDSAEARHRSKHHDQQGTAA